MTFQFFRSNFHDPVLFEQDLTYIAVGFVAWSALYSVIRMLPNSMLFKEEPSKADNLDLRNRIVSIIHGTSALCAGAYHFIQGGAECGVLNTSLQRAVLCFSLSYFTYDLVCMWIEGILDKAMMIHHPLCLLGLFIPLYENISGMECMLAIFLSEISNPMMHIRQILRISGRRYTKAYEITEVTFISLYFYARFIAIGPVVY
jgi:hypothetical protein